MSTVNNTYELSKHRNKITMYPSVGPNMVVEINKNQPVKEGIYCLRPLQDDNYILTSAPYIERNIERLRSKMATNFRFKKDVGEVYKFESVADRAFVVTPSMEATLTEMFGDEIAAALIKLRSGDFDNFSLTANFTQNKGVYLHPLTVDDIVAVFKEDKDSIYDGRLIYAQPLNNGIIQLHDLIGEYHDGILALNTMLEFMATFIERRVVDYVRQRNAFARQAEIEFQHKMHDIRINEKMERRIKFTKEIMDLHKEDRL